MSSAFVTGGTGFVGGAVLEALAAAENGDDIRALVRSEAGAAKVRALGAEPVLGDVLDPGTLDTMRGCEIVFHVAGMNAYCLPEPGPMFDANIRGSVNVVRAAAKAGVRRIVYTSSAVTLGEKKGTIGAENSPHRGSFLTHYERSKFEAEQAVLAEGIRLGVEVVSVNPASVQGPGRTTGTAHLLIGYLNGRLRMAFDSRLNIVDVDDSAQGHVLAARRGEPGERYVLSGRAVTVREALEMLGKLTGLDTRVPIVPAWMIRAAGRVIGGAARIVGATPPVCAEVVRVLEHGHVYDGSRAERELGLSYSPLEETLRRTISWYVDSGYVIGPLPRFGGRTLPDSGSASSAGATPP